MVDSDYDHLVIVEGAVWLADGDSGPHGQNADGRRSVQQVVDRNTANLPTVVLDGGVDARLLLRLAQDPSHEDQALPRSVGAPGHRNRDSRSLNTLDLILFDQIVAL